MYLDASTAWQAVDCPLPPRPTGEKLGLACPGGAVGDERPEAFGFLAGIPVGTRIADYHLEEKIGQGGMAVVFRAQDERLKRPVALKILSPALATDEAFRHRFIRESRSAAAVDDPHIIPVFEAGESDGVLFIAMRYVRGGDVRTLIDRNGPLPAGRAALSAAMPHGEAVRPRAANGRRHGPQHQRATRRQVRPRQGPLPLGLPRPERQP